MTAVLDLDIGNTRTKWRCGGAPPLLQRLALNCRDAPHLALDCLAVAHT